MNRWEPIGSVLDLKVGDIIRNVGSSQALVVTWVGPDECIAIRTTHVSNPPEWRKLVATTDRGIKGSRGRRS